MHDKTTIPHIATANLIIDYGYTFQVPKLAATLYIVRAGYVKNLLLIIN